MRLSRFVWSCVFSRVGLRLESHASQVPDAGGLSFFRAQAVTSCQRGTARRMQTLASREYQDRYLAATFPKDQHQTYSTQRQPGYESHRPSLAARTQPELDPRLQGSVPRGPPSCEPIITQDGMIHRHMAIHTSLAERYCDRVTNSKFALVRGMEGFLAQTVGETPWMRHRLKP